MKAGRALIIRNFLRNARVRFKRNCHENFSLSSLLQNKMNGNLAMKDIELGLKWVKENISKFGGNRKSITLMGSGGGAAIANLLMLTNSLTSMN